MDSTGWCGKRFLAEKGQELQKKHQSITQSVSFTLKTTWQHCGDEKESCKTGNDACKNVVNVGERNDPGERLAEGKHLSALELRLIYVSLMATNQMLPRLQLFIFS